MGLTRSEQMRRIRSRGTTAERMLVRILRPLGVRGREQYETPRGLADYAFPSKKVALFVDGCQWHGCPDHYVRPRSNAQFWAAKLKANVRRDRRQTVGLRAAGWRVVRILEHEIFESPNAVVARVTAALGEASYTPGPLWRVLSVLEIEGTGCECLERRSMVSISRYSRSRVEIRKRRTTKWKKQPSPKIAIDIDVNDKGSRS